MRSASAMTTRIVSAHRTPDRLYAFAKGAKDEGFQVIIAGAGGAAHLPGMTASMTPLPVFGVPVETQGAGGHGSASFHRPDAGRHSGRHARHRQGRRDQCRASRRERPGAARSRRSPPVLTTGAPRRPRRSPKPRHGRAPDLGTRRSSALPPARPSGFSAAASSAACSRSTAAGSASRSISTVRTPAARPSTSPPRTRRPPMTTSRRSIRFAAAVDRRHLRIRERAGPHRRNSRRAQSRFIPASDALATTQDRLAEKTFLRGSRHRHRRFCRRQRQWPISKPPWCRSAARRS